MIFKPKKTRTESDNTVPAKSHTKLRIALVLIIIGACACGGIFYLTAHKHHFRWGLKPSTMSDFNASAPGDCFDWPTGKPERLHIVSCGSPHYFEVSATITDADLNGDFSPALANIFKPPSPYPNPSILTELRQSVCEPKTVQYLGHQLSRDGLYTVGLQYSNVHSWSQGDRVFRCGIQKLTPAGVLERSVDSARTVDNSWLWQPGQCLAEFKGIRAVPCNKPHHLEALGAVKIPYNVNNYPSVEQQNTIILPLCSELALRYLGSKAAIDATTLIPLWDTLTREEWDNKQRKINCYLGFPRVDVADQPSAPATNAPKAPKKPTAPKLATLVGSAKNSFTIDGHAPAPLPQAPPGEQRLPAVPLPPGISHNPTSIPVSP